MKLCISVSATSNKSYEASVAMSVIASAMRDLAIFTLRILPESWIFVIVNAKDIRWMHGQVPQSQKNICYTDYFP